MILINDEGQILPEDADKPANESPIIFAEQNKGGEDEQQTVERNS